MANPGAARDTSDPPPGFDEWLNERASAAERIALQRDAETPRVGPALVVVRKFVEERGLVLLGGQAIDYALRLKGKELYPPGNRPDYDFFSPDSVKDAYDLAELLRRGGFANVSAIRAIHIQTMRVGTDFIYVGDVGYAPPVVLDRIPTLVYEGVRLVHPDYQRCDMHLGLSFPLENPPRVTIDHRFAKDLKRLRMLEDAYPMRPLPDAPLARTTDAGGAIRIVSALAIKGPNPPSAALGGFVAYAMYRKKYAEMRGDRGLPDVPGPAIGPGRVPAGCDVDLASPDVPATMEALGDAGNVTWYYPYMDLFPVSARITVGGQGITVQSTKNRLLLMTEIDGTWTVSVHYAMMQLQARSFIEATASVRAVNRACYIALFHMTEAVNGSYRERPPADGAAAPFALGGHVLGNKNVSVARRIKTQVTRKLLKTPDPILEAIPDRYFLPAPRPAPFDYGSSPMFHRAGEVVDAADAMLIAALPQVVI